MKTPYWVIKCPVGYWLEEGGCSPKQRQAEKFKTRELAKREMDRWTHPGNEAWLVRVIARRRIETWPMSFA